MKKNVLQATMGVIVLSSLMAYFGSHTQAEKKKQVIGELETSNFIIMIATV